MQMCSCSGLIYSKCSLNISQSIIAAWESGAFIYYVAEKFVEEEAEGWAEKVPA